MSLTSSKLPKKKVLYYFFSGHTAIKDGSFQEFSGHVRDAEGKWCMDILKDLTEDCKKIYGNEILIISFNVIGERDE